MLWQSSSTVCVKFTCESVLKMTRVVTVGWIGCRKRFLAENNCVLWTMHRIQPCTVLFNWSIQFIFTHRFLLSCLFYGTVCTMYSIIPSIYSISSRDNGIILLTHAHIHAHTHTTTNNVLCTVLYRASVSTRQSQRQTSRPGCTRFCRTKIGEPLDRR